MDEDLGLAYLLGDGGGVLIVGGGQPEVGVSLDLPRFKCLKQEMCYL